MYQPRTGIGDAESPVESCAVRRPTRTPRRTRRRLPISGRCTIRRAGSCGRARGAPRSSAPPARRRGRSSSRRSSPLRTPRSGGPGCRPRAGRCSRGSECRR
ncbi:MAG: hypothetical protein EHM19_12175, partial [Candidatus Latescibacterota bacterium]